MSTVQNLDGARPAQAHTKQRFPRPINSEERPKEEIKDLEKHGFHQELVGSLRTQSLNIRQPLLARGPKAAGFGVVRLSKISGHALSYQGMLLFSGPKQIGR